MERNKQSAKASSPSFRVYIDESGDEGFLFRPDGSGSSRWFVISALVIRKCNDLKLVSSFKEIRQLLRKPVNASLHFSELRHEQKVPYLKKLAELPIRSVNVAIHKPSINEPEKFQSEKYRLYRYATRLLLERVSWLCRDSRDMSEGDGSAEIVFSNRSNMSYEDIRDYLRLLLEKSGEDGVDAVQVLKSVIIPENIRSVEHSKLAGLQAVDAIASGFHMALKRNIYGETESAYIQILRKSVYAHKGTCFGYGIKLWPGNLEDMKKDAPEVENLESVFGK